MCLVQSAVVACPVLGSVVWPLVPMQSGVGRGLPVARHICLLRVVLGLGQQGCVVEAFCEECQPHSPAGSSGAPHATSTHSARTQWPLTSPLPACLHCHGFSWQPARLNRQTPPLDLVHAGWVCQSVIPTVSAQATNPQLATTSADGLLCRELRFSAGQACGGAFG